MNDLAAASPDFSSMTKCYSGGAPVAPGIVDQFQAKLGVRIHNIYGLTFFTRFADSLHETSEYYLQNAKLKSPLNTANAKHNH